MDDYDGDHENDEEDYDGNLMVMRIIWCSWPWWWWGSEDKDTEDDGDDDGDFDNDVPNIVMMMILGCWWSWWWWLWYVDYYDQILDDYKTYHLLK